MTQQAKAGAGAPRLNGRGRLSVSVPTPWSAIQFRQLATLAAVAEAGSFQGAAELLGYTPSAVSQHISSLERAFGARLVVRANSRERVRPTPIGRVVLTHWERVAGELRATAAELSSVAAGASGTLTVGSFPSFAARYLPAILEEVWSAAPQSRIDLREAMSSTPLYSAIATGEIDLGITVVPPPSPQFEWVELYRDPFVLVVPVGSELARRRAPFGRTELVRLPLLCFRDCPGTEQALAALSVGGTSPRIEFRADYSVVLQALVRAGRGCALIPLQTVAQEPAVAIIELADAVPARISAIAWRRDRETPPLARLFIDAARRVCIGR
jgi:DNA-binding transcriptional LysR family regulator